MSRVDEHGNVTGRMSIKCAEMRRLRADCTTATTIIAMHADKHDHEYERVRSRAQAFPSRACALH